MLTLEQESPRGTFILEPDFPVGIPPVSLVRKLDFPHSRNPPPPSFKLLSLYGNTKTFFSGAFNNFSKVVH
jgi:hypothetical protein